MQSTQIDDREVYSPALGKLRNAALQWLRFGMKRLALAQRWIDRRPILTFSLLTILYAASVWGLSWFKLLWLDELITLHIARLPTVGAIWRALALGADPNPPLTHILVHFSRMFFGETELALRLPAMVGYWVGMVALYAFLERRLGAAWALAGTLTSMATAAFEYSYESRSYAIFYGLTMLAFFCWSEAVRPALSARRRWLALAGMTLALATALCTNYFSVVSFLPIAFGQLTRDALAINRAFRRERLRRSSLSLRLLGKVEWSHWLALCLASLPLLFFRKLIEHSIAQFAPSAWNHVSWDYVVSTYYVFLDKTWMAVAALVVLVCCTQWLATNCRASLRSLRPRWLATLTTRQDRLSEPVLHPWELMGVIALCLYPVLGFWIASLHGGMLCERFVLPVIYGLGITAALCGYRLFQSWRGVSVIFVLAALAWFFTRNAIAGENFSNQKDAFWRMMGHLPQVAGSGSGQEPIAVPDPLLGLTFAHYAPPGIAERMVFPVDYPAIRLFRGQDSPEENLWPVRQQLYPELHVMPLANFERSAGRYVIVAGFGNWMVETLLHHGYPVQLSPVDPEARDDFAFTAICYGFPNFFLSAGDPYLASHPAADAAVRFVTAEDVPDAKKADPLLY